LGRTEAGPDRRAEGNGSDALFAVNVERIDTASDSEEFCDRELAARFGLSAE
jgi:hypothetical protein